MFDGFGGFVEKFLINFGGCYEVRWRRMGLWFFVLLRECKVEEEFGYGEVM